MSTEPIMQICCVNCGRKQYGPAVFDISHGEHPCVWCGHIPKVYLSEREYWDDVKAQRLKAEGGEG